MSTDDFPPRIDHPYQARTWNPSSPRSRENARKALRQVRDYLLERLGRAREDILALRKADRPSEAFSTAIDELERLLDQACIAADQVMGDAEAVEAATTALGKLQLASSLLGAIARDHGAVMAKNCGTLSAAPSADTVIALQKFCGRAGKDRAGQDRV